MITNEEAARLLWKYLLGNWKLTNEFTVHLLGGEKYILMQEFFNIKTFKKKRITTEWEGEKWKVLAEREG